MPCDPPSEANEPRCLDANPRMRWLRLSNTAVDFRKDQRGFCAGLFGPRIFVRAKNVEKSAESASAEIYNRCASAADLVEPRPSFTQCEPDVRRSATRSSPLVAPFHS
jgi:hypothetical protein